MPPRHRSSSGYRGVRARPNGTFYAEIRSGDERIEPWTFETGHEAVACRLGRSRLDAATCGIARAAASGHHAQAMTAPP
jgi:hypothetical protein